MTMNEQNDTSNHGAQSAQEPWSRAADYCQPRLGDQAPYTSHPEKEAPSGTVPPFAPAPQPSQKRKGPDGCLIAVITAAVMSFVLGLFVVLGLTSCMAEGASGHDAYESMEEAISELAPGMLSDPDIAEGGNATLRNLLGQGTSTDPFSKSELKQLQSDLFSKAQAKGSNLPQGIYFVGSGKNDVKAGQYWIGGSDTNESYYFVLEKSSVIKNNYTCKLVNTYYGHNIAEVSDGQVLVVINGEEGFCTLSKMNKKFSDPYTNGVFRVGTDIPEGTYFLQPGKDPDNKFAYYVMDNLSYEGDYIVDQKEETEISAFTGLQVTVKNGQYLELYNATATKGTQG